MFHRIFITFLLWCPAVPVIAETIVAARTLRSRAILSASDIVVQEGNIPGALTDPAEAIGKEARVVLYAGRPIRAADIGPPAIIERNQVVTLFYRKGGLQISAEGRALARGGIGDKIRVMNLASRITVTGEVHPDGTVFVND